MVSPTESFIIFFYISFTMGVSSYNLSSIAMWFFWKKHSMYFYAKYLHYPLPIRQYQYGLHKYDIHLSIFRSCALTLKTPSKIFTQQHIVNLGECEKL